MNRISKLRFKPPSQIGLKGIQPPPEKGMRLENAADAGYGCGPSPRDLDGRASDKAPARTGTSFGLKVGIGIPLIFVEFL